MMLLVTSLVLLRKNEIEKQKQLIGEKIFRQKIAKKVEGQMPLFFYTPVFLSLVLM
jgi:hypothetical protein